MIIKQLTRQEKLTESRKLLKNILQRTKNIERRGLTSAFYAVNSFNELRKSLPKDISVLSDKELNNLYRDLKYINNLKTSYVKGAEEVANKFAPIKEKLSYLSKEKQNEFWKMYGKLYERTATFEHFKYELFETNIDYIYDGEDVDFAVANIIEKYDETLKELGSKGDDENVRILFTSKLKDLRK